MPYIHPIGRCSDCGKLRFENRKATKKYINKRFPGDHMTIYKCGEYFHFGHTPYGIKRGTTDRRKYVGAR